MLKLDRDYASVGIISAGSGLYVYDNTLKKYVLLVPTSDMPEGAGQPDAIDNPLLTVSRNGQVEGKQTLDQKEYTYNWNRDNNRRLEKYAGKQVEFLERDGMEYTGNKFIGTLSYDKDAFADNEIMNGKIYITVNEDQGYADDIRDIIAPTAIITSALPTLNIAGTDSVSMALRTSLNATVTASSNNSAVTVTATKDDTTKTYTLTVTGSNVTSMQYAIITLTCTATGEGTSERTFMVNLAPKSE